MEPDEDAEELSAGYASLASLGLSSWSSHSMISPSHRTNVSNRDENTDIHGTASSAPFSSINHNNHRILNSSGSSQSSAESGNGLRFSLRSSNRTSFLQSLTGAAMGHTNHTSSSSGRNSRDRHSAPFLHLAGRDIKCPMCHKKVNSDDVEVHLVMCITKPRIAYNKDVLNANKGECSICFDEMTSGDTIARLPCLCIYHKKYYIFVVKEIFLILFFKQFLSKIKIKGVN